MCLVQVLQAVVLGYHGVRCQGLPTQADEEVHGEVGHKHKVDDRKDKNWCKVVPSKKTVITYYNCDLNLPYLAGISTITN